MKEQHLSLDQTADTYLPRGVDHLGFIEAKLRDSAGHPCHAEGIISREA